MANAINSLNYGNNIYTFTLPYGVCGTAADTAAKTVTVDNFSLETGATVIVKFTYANSVASPTLNVNGTGAKAIMIYGTTSASTGTTTSGWIAGAVQMFTYDGTNWVRDYWNNTTYSNASLGCGYATCGTAAATTAKAATLSSYALTTGGIVSIKFTYDVPASATLNINSKGAKNIYYRGAAITAGVIKAGDIATFVYSSQYHLIAIDRWQNDIANHIADTTKHITSTERTNWGAAYTHSQAAHAPSNAQANQNAFSNVTVGSTTIAADTTTDTLTLVAGSNITLTPDATNDKITIAATNTTYTFDGAVSTIKDSNLTANRALISNSSGKVAVSAVTSTELGYLDGVTSNIQTQLNGKAASSHSHDYLPLTGGTISGVITTTDGEVANRNVTTGGTYYYGGTGFDDGAFLGLYGKDQSNYKGQFRLKADNGENFVYLEGTPSGSLRWNGENVLTDKSNISFDNIGIIGKLPIGNGGTNASTAASARTNLGFTYGTTEPSGTPSTGEGSVYFRAGGDVVVDVGTDGIWTYRKWASGIAECWGNGQYAVDCTSAAGSLYYGSATISLPSGLFSSSTYSVVATCGTSTGSGWPVYGRTGSPSTSSFSAAFYNTASASGKVINVQMHVMGRWK